MRRKSTAILAHHRVLLQAESRNLWQSCSEEPADPGTVSCCQMPVSTSVFGFGVTIAGHLLAAISSTAVRGRDFVPPGADLIFSEMDLYRQGRQGCYHCRGNGPPTGITCSHQLFWAQAAM